jgi:hypothetical protein
MWSDNGKKMIFLLILVVLTFVCVQAGTASEGKWPTTAQCNSIKFSFYDFKIFKVFSLENVLEISASKIVQGFFKNWKTIENRKMNPVYDRCKKKQRCSQKKIYLKSK